MKAIATTLFLTTMLTSISASAYQPGHQAQPIFTPFAQTRVLKPSFKTPARNLRKPRAVKIRPVNFRFSNRLTTPTTGIPVTRPVAKPSVVKAPEKVLPTKKLAIKQIPTVALISPAVVQPEPTPSVQQKLAPSGSKQVFLNKLNVIVNKENNRILALQTEVASLIQRIDEGQRLSKHEATRLRVLGKKYRIKKNPVDTSSARKELLEKVDIIPVSLALAQAVNESGWGKSRFAREGNNLFGIWTYDESKGIVPKKRSAGKKHLVRKFDTLGDSVRYYMHNLNSHPAYASLRRIRAESRFKNQSIDGIDMAAGLLKYSEKGKEYVRLIRDIITRYDLAKFDSTSKRQA